MQYRIEHPPIEHSQYNGLSTKALPLTNTTLYINPTLAILVKQLLKKIYCKRQQTHFANFIRGDLGQGEGRFRLVPLVVPNATRE